MQLQGSRMNYDKRSERECEKKKKHVDFVWSIEWGFSQGITASLSNSRERKVSFPIRLDFILLVSSPN